ncbi:MAG TPA: hypothetical protein VI670_26670 [Thermoanaerobaculia bacterium]|jgi:hypothetical protein
MITLVVFLLAMGGAGLSTGNDKPPSLPAVVYSASTSVAAPPLWVSSRVAFDKNGDLRADLFEPGFRTMLEANRAANAEGGCRAALGAPVIEDHAPKGNLDEVTTSALTIVSGDVVGADAGFYNGAPGTLFQIAVHDVAKSMGRFRGERGIARVFIAEATIPTPHGTICSREPFAAAIPAVGDRVLLFSSVDPIDAERRILPVEARSQLIIEHAGTLHVPAALRGTGSQSIKQLLSVVRTNPHINDVPLRRGVQ